MKLNRITSLAAVVVAVLIVVGQFVAGVKAAPPAQPTAQFQASISAQVSPPAMQNVSKGQAARPAAQAPYLITVQGRLTAPSGNPITVATNVTFKLYTAPSGGTAFFTEGPVSITPDSNGLFTYQMGSTVSISTAIIQTFASPVYLGITAGSDAQMAPRFTLTASPYAMSLAPGAVVSGSSGGYPGVVNAFNTDTTSSYNAGLYAEGATGVRVLAYSTGTTSGYGGFFVNYGGGSGIQDGVYASSTTGTGVVGLGGQNSLNAGGDFNGLSGIHSNGAGASTSASNDGVDAGGSGGTSYGYYTTQPAGDTNFSFYGFAHIHGTNITAASYELEVRYHGSGAAQMGDVLALDGNNETVNGTSVLGVVKANASNANAAVGVLAYRLDTSNVNGADKTLIDANATQVKSGDRAYIVIAGQVQMKVSGSVNIGDRVGFASDGSIAVTKDIANSIGKVASKPDSNGMVTVVVNFK